MKRLWWVYLVVPATLVLDWLSKTRAVALFGGVKSLVPGFLEIRVVFNRGVLFGLGEQSHSSSAGLHVHLIWGLGLALVLGLALRTPSKKRMRHIGFACMIGGALGNGLDRLAHGYVVDFLQVLFLPILNVADLVFLLGLLLVAGDVTRTQLPDEGELHASDPI